MLNSPLPPHLLMPSLESHFCKIPSRHSPFYFFGQPNSVSLNRQVQYMQVEKLPTELHSILVPPEFSFFFFSVLVVVDVVLCFLSFHGGWWSMHWLPMPCTPVPGGLNEPPHACFGADVRSFTRAVLTSEYFVSFFRPSNGSVTDHLRTNVVAVIT